MRITVGKFAYSHMRTCLGTDVAAGVRRALRYYASTSESGQVSTDIPPFNRDWLLLDSGVPVELEWDAEFEALLRREAGRKGVSTSMLATHAVLVYLAALDRR
jgi:hypothetical protein